MRALDAGDPHTAATTLRRALAMWRGPALADLPERDAAAARAEALRLAALHRRIDADLACDRPADVVPELRELVADHPLDETFHAQLIRALRAAGHSADALAAYEEVRELLADRLGTDPGTELRELHRQLLAGEPPPTGAMPPPGPPTAGRAADGDRYRRPDGDRDSRPDGEGYRYADRDRDLDRDRDRERAAGGDRDSRPDGEGYRYADRDRDRDRDRERAAGGDRDSRPDGEGYGYADRDRDRDRAADGDHYRSPDRDRDRDRERAAGGDRDSRPDGEGYSYADRDRDRDRAPHRDRHRRPDRDGDSGRDRYRAADRTRDRAPGREPRPAAHPAPPGNLRARLTSFVGRQSDIGALRRDLDGSRLVTLTGPGGSGKTRLSEETAATATGAYPDGVWVVELASLDDSSAVPGAVLSAVGRRETTLLASGLEGRTGGADPVDPATRLVEYCADRRLLLLLDNCEHVIDTVARLTEALLARCPGVTVLATSREPLGVPGETVRPVEPLPPAPAHQLFAERAATVRPGFDPAGDPDTAAAVAEICRRLDGLPLAIELAAARLRLLTPRQIADRLDDRFHLLTNGSRTALPRQQTLRAVVDWSWDLLDERERTVLRRVSVFAGGWGLAAAEAVCADAPGREDIRAGASAPAHAPAHSGAPIAPPEVLDLLGALADKSLLAVDHPPGARTSVESTAVESAEGADETAGGAAGWPMGEARYRMLETIHEYVSERAAEDAAARADHAAASARHIAHFRDFARAAEPRLRSAEQLPWLRRVETDLDNIRAALHRSLTARDEDTAFAIILAMGWFWWLRNYRDEGAAWADRALSLGRGPHSEGDGEGGDGPAVDVPPPVPDGIDGDDPAATRYWHAMDLRLLRFFMLADTGHSPDVKDPRTRLIAQRIREAYDSHPGPRSARFPGLLWPFAGYILDGHAAVLPLMGEAVVNCREYGDDWSHGVALMFRMHLSIDSSSGMGRAEADYAELRELSTRVGDRWMLAQVESAGGEMATLRGRLTEARAAFEEARRLAREIGAHTEVPFLITRLADLALNSGDIEGAVKLLDQSEQEAERWGVLDVQGFNASLRGHIELLRGDPAGARACCEDARRRAVKATPPPLFWVVLQGLEGRVRAEEGDPWGGLRMLRDTLRKGVEVGCTEALLAQQAESAAYILVRHGQERLAVRLLGAAEGWRGRLPRTPLALAETRETEARAAAELGPATTGKLRDQAAALTAEEAIALFDEVLTPSDADADADAEAAR
ncbi:LuxR family protein kinase/transcriptional regulator [Streptomyces himastatinicus ATCC 53653]|uniref:LuxR family protein kinase/transcriptional regulator n=2 Tax=Streptomyces violaceusniger group TaxID=2839105 RepID=D9WUB3_9ACTN|nr:LuxR family protein kinase/transcriptional regulator [Streptomyces himastatinicus ATCC 53653]